MKYLNIFSLISALFVCPVSYLIAAQSTQVDSNETPSVTAHPSPSKRLYTSMTGGYVYSGSDFDGFGISVLGGFNFTESKAHNIELEYIHIQLDGDSTTLRGSLGVAAIPGLPPLGTGTYNSSINQATIKENMVLCNYRYMFPPLTFSNDQKIFFDLGAGLGASFAEREVSGVTRTTATAMGFVLMDSSEATKTTDTSTEFVGQIFGALNLLLNNNVSLKLGIRSLFTRDFDLKVKRATISNEVYQLMVEAGIHIAF